MIIIGGMENLKVNCISQLQSKWKECNISIIEDVLEETLERMEKLLMSISKGNKYVWKEGEIVFSPYHSVQYSIFLYLLSNTIYKKCGGIKEADMVYYLNKIMNSCDWFYAIELPTAFYAEHPIGSVLGRAVYGENFFIYQGTTVGGNRDKEGKLFYPVIGSGVTMYANSSILGKSVVGNNVILAANCTVLNDVVPDNSIVFGKSPDLIIKRKDEQEMMQRTATMWER